MVRRYIPNAWETHGDIYHVAQKCENASDDNPGTEELPFKAISAAAAKVKEFDRVMIDEGIYREQVPITGHGHPYEPLTLVFFMAIPGKEVYLTGADPFDADWKETAAGTYKAKLPESLFADGAYNPYELSCVVDEPGKVRPADGPELPETLGQIYVDDEPLEQLTSVQAVTDTSNSFVVSADGTEIICHFANSKAPAAGTVELTVRERCFKPTFEIPNVGEGGELAFSAVYIQTRGMIVERAADPGPFSTSRLLSIRKNRGTGIEVRKTFSAVYRAAENVIMRGNLCYRSKDKPTIFCPRIDRSVRCRPEDAEVIPMLSDDGARTWRRHDGDNLRPASYFLDEEKNMLLRYYKQPISEVDNAGEYGANTYRLVYELSADEGKTWTEPEAMDLSGRGSAYGIIKLQNGKLLWVTTKNVAEVGYYCGACKIFIGTWREDLSGVDWESPATINADLNLTRQGIGEPHACQFEDGRIFIIFRMDGLTPSQDDPGKPALKSFSISEDNGRTWTKPAPLCYEDGRYVYSSTSFPDTFYSSKNGKPYVIININKNPCTGCDPRTVLQIAELNTDPVAVKRDTIAIIDERLPEHHFHVRLSNWITLEERKSKNMLLFMKLQMSEHCPVRSGYDFNCYRYEIILPD